MQIVFTKEVINCRTGILIIRGRESPSWPAFGVTLGVWLDNADVNEFGQAFQMADEIYTMGEGTKEADIEVVAAFLGGEFLARDDAMPAVSSCGLVDWGLGCHGRWDFNTIEQLGANFDVGNFGVLSCSGVVVSIR